MSMQGLIWIPDLAEPNKSEGDLLVITKYIYNYACLTFFPNLEVLLNLMVFMDSKDLNGYESTRSFYREMLEVTPN
jgi:hypothetical protein